MRVSVISPLFNGLHYSRQMLASLLATWPAEVSGEIILVDNGSTDGTPAWLRRLTDPRIKVMRNSTNLGYAVANNQAAAVAKGEFLILINNDLVLLKGWMEAILETQTRTNAAIVGNVQINPRTDSIDHAGMYFEEDGHPYHHRPPVASIDGLEEVRAPAVTGACMLVRRDWFREVGGFDTDYRNGYEDVDLCMKAHSCNRTVAVAASSVICHFVGSSEGRHDAERDNLERFAKTWRDSAAKLASLRPPMLDAAAKVDSNTQTKRHTYLQVFLPSKVGYSEQNSQIFFYPTNCWTSIALRLPPKSGSKSAIRIDPSNFRSVISLNSITLRISTLRFTVQQLKGNDLINQIETLNDAQIRQLPDQSIQISCTGNDPQLLFKTPRHLIFPLSLFPIDLEICLERFDSNNED